jgi:hypothetical protein
LKYIYIAFFNFLAFSGIFQKSTYIILSEEFSGNSNGYNVARIAKNPETATPEEDDKKTNSNVNDKPEFIINSY